MSYTAIDNYLWEIERRLMSKYGVNAARLYMSPLKWYINTGRASIAFLHALLASKPFMIGRKLAAGGSDDEIISRVKAYIMPE